MRTGDQAIQPNGSGHILRDDDYDSGLEYVECPPLPNTSPQQPSVARSPPPLFLSSSSSPSPSPPSPSSQPLTKGKSRALEADAVPGTETEQSQDSGLQADDNARVSSRFMSSPPKNSVLGKMKPRTPGSKRNIPDADIIASPLPLRSPSGSPQPRFRKSLHPIPQVSPSTFTNLPSSMIESVEMSGGEESSIEQFESPDKSARTGTKEKGREEKEKGESQEVIPESTDASGSGNGSLPVPLAARDVVNKGTTMADAAKKAKMSGNGVPIQAKLPLTVVIGREKERAESHLSGVEEEEEEEGDRVEEEEGQHTQEKSGEREPSTLEEFADSFVNYDAGIGEDATKTEASSRSAVQAVFLPQEEEESTQDLLMELKQRPIPDVNEGWEHPAQIVEDSQQQPNEDEEMADVVDSLEVAPKVCLY